MNTKKYWAVVDTFWQRALTYRFTVISYRIGEIIELVTLILLWSAIYERVPNIGGFSFKEMVTYLLTGNLFRVMVRNFLPSVIDKDIKDGKLSLFLVKPMTYFQFILVKEIGRISVATIMSIISQVIVVLLFSNLFIVNFEILHILVILAMLILAFLTELLLAYLIGLVAFWTDESEGLYYSVDSLKKLLSGSYFPLSLLPGAFLNISLLSPFAYSFYVPTQVYLNKLNLFIGLKGLIVQAVWIAILYLIIQIVWKMGLKKYEGVGI